MQEISAQEYQQLAARTLINAPHRQYSALEIMLVWNAIGLCGEVGELIAAEPEKMEEECGDTVWYIAALYTKIGAIMPDYHRKHRSPNPSMSLVVAASKVTDTIKKQVFHDHGLDLFLIKDLLDDLIDAFYYYCDCNAIDPYEAMAGNVEKLKDRYPDGWDTERSINRIA